MKQWSLIFLLISFSAGSQNKDELIKIDVTKINAQAGQEALVRILVSLKNGYHIQAHEVTDELIIPTTLEIAGDQNFVLKKQVFPSTKKFMLSGTDQYLDVYDGEFEIQTFLATPKNIKSGVYHLTGKLKYQACDSVRCLFPRTIEFSINVDVQRAL